MLEFRTELVIVLRRVLNMCGPSHHISYTDEHIPDLIAIKQCTVGEPARLCAFTQVYDHCLRDWTSN